MEDSVFVVSSRRSACCMFKCLGDLISTKIWHVLKDEVEFLHWDQCNFKCHVLRRK